MIKEITYSGVSMVHSDHDAHDGELSIALNLLPDISGALRPVMDPAVKIAGLTFSPLAIHITSAQTNLILYDEDGGRILYRSLDDADAGNIPLSTCSSRPAIAVLGNTLFISDNISSTYFLWKGEEGEYIKLGQEIPEIDIDIALGHTTSNPLSDTLSIPLPEGVSGDLAISLIGGLSGGSRVVPPRDNQGIFIEAVNNAILGFLNKSVADAHAEDLFVMPFMARWALRLFDGSYIHQSAPILMLPNSLMPRLFFSSKAENGCIVLTATLPLRKCSMLFKASGLAALSKWKDIVKSIDFFVSPPIYNYDQSGNVSAYHRVKEEKPFSFSGLLYPVASAEDTSGESQSGYVDDNGHRHPASIVSSSNKFYKFSDGNGEQQVNYPSSSSVVPASFPIKNVEDKISSVSNFYLISSLPVEDLDIADDTMPDFLKLDISDSALSNIVVRPRLSDDWRSHDTLLFSHAYSYNSRLILSGVIASLFKGFKIPSMSQFFRNSDNPDAVVCDVWIKIVRNSKSLWVVSQSSLPGGRIPRYLFYPDPNATECRIICADGSGGWLLPLKTHDFLNGAYWFDGLGEERTPKQSDLEAPSTTSDSLPRVSERNKIFQSEVGNPFLFPLEGRVSVGSGDVMATSAAVRALSQGQFGQFPVYAFASDGVWALDTSGSGTFSSVRPVSRDVCTDPDAITQVDDAVLFPSKKGIMLLSGSSSSSFSEIIEEEFPFPAESALPFWPQIRAASGCSFPELKVVPFSQFMDGCRLAYVYNLKRIILFNPEYRYSFIFSLESKKWGMASSSLVSAVNAYTHAYAIDTAGDLLDLSLSSGVAVKVFLMTRPFSFGMPDVMKTIRTMIQRGVFGRNDLQCVLFGSRDLSSWICIRSSEEAALRNFHGSPYKMFRLVVFGTLAPEKSLTGASVQLDLRLTNRLR